MPCKENGQGETQEDRQTKNSLRYDELALRAVVQVREPFCDHVRDRSSQKASQITTDIERVERQTRDERHAQLLGGGLVAGPRETHEGHVVELRDPDDGTSKSDITRCHAIHCSMGFDLFGFETRQ